MLMEIDQLSCAAGWNIFTGRIPFVWVGNNISNPGLNPNLYPAVNPSLFDPTTITSDKKIATKDNSILMQSGDLKRNG